MVYYPRLTETLRMTLNGWQESTVLRTKTLLPFQKELIQHLDLINFPNPCPSLFILYSNNEPKLMNIYIHK